MSDDHDHFCSALEVLPEQLRAKPGFASRAALLNRAFWGQGARLTISFLEGERPLHERVAEIAERWITETGADVQFEFWIGVARDPREANIRIAFRPDRGSNSLLGKFALDVTDGSNTMNLGWMTLDLPQDKANSVVLHEFGHSLGLIHEHLNPQRPVSWNKPQVIDDLRRTQGWNDDTIQRNMFAHYDPQELTATDVDPNSIMMYAIPARWTTDGFTTPFNSALTAQDKALIQAAYGTRTQFGAR
jgi:serralysin